MIHYRQRKIYELITIKNIFIIAICLIIFMLVVTNYISKIFIEEIENQIRLEIKQKVDMAYNAVIPVIEARRKGEITIKEAREKIANHVRNMIYPDNQSDNYIFMSTYHGYYLVQPFEPEKEGTNMWDYRDPKGTYVIRELVKASQKSPEGSYVRYFQKLPNTERIEEKLSYVRGIPEIQAYIGTGVYLDSKNKKLFLLLKTQRTILNLFTALMVFLIILYVYKYKIMNRQLMEEIKKRMEAEKQLIEEKERETFQKKRLETLFNHSQDAIVEFDTEGKILNINKSFEKIFGYIKEEVLGKDMDKLIVPKEKYSEAKKLTNTTLEKGIVNVESIRYRKDTTPVDVLIRNVHIKVSHKVLGGYGIYTDITKVKNYKKKLEHMSIYDVLTGLYNFNYFESQIDEYKNGRPISMGIIMCDLNGLKLINDALGHQYGDILLKSFADVLKKSVREKDIVARTGGDEFTVILTGTSKGDVEKIIKRMKDNIEEHNRFIENKMLKLSVAIGYSIGENKNIDKALKEADDAMYRNKLMKKESSKRQILSVLMAMLSEKDFVTSGHTKRVAHMCESIADKLELDEDKQNRLILLAEVHDLGKIAIPEHILKKSDPLTPEEWEIMKSHTEKGYRIALNSHELSGIADLILKHHERWDGKGYPLGLSQKDIPIECRILSVVDAYDAMTNSRPYDQVKTHEEAIEEIKRCRGTQFDPEIVDIFVSIKQHD